MWRDIRCFIAPQTDHHERLLLGIPWLYAVNAIISIKLSMIQVGDPGVGETIRQVTGPELVYGRDHNLLMYPKAVIPLPKGTIASNDDKSASEPDSSSWPHAPD